MLLHLGLALLLGCLDPYEPPVAPQDRNVLVVDGFLNSTDRAATVKLSHTVSISSSTTFSPERGAEVSIQSKAGYIFPLVEMDSGVYVASGLDLTPDDRYRLNIHTDQGENYVSDFIELKNVPPIDSVHWEPGEDGLTIYVNTHDFSGNTKHYRWYFDETWEYHAAFASDYKLVNGEPVFRTNEERIHKCWRYVNSTEILIGSTEQLQSDIVSRQPLMFIPKRSKKTSVKYSIRVKQRSITQDEYHFLQQIQKTTEDLGSLFDPQPSRVVGNIHREGDLSSPVLGYFSGGSITEQRIYIDFYDLPDDLMVPPSKEGCRADTMCLYRSANPIINCNKALPDVSPGELILSPIFSGPSIIGYLYTTPACADCRSQGGVLERPSFWF